MTTTGTVARLEALLSRVRKRAAEARPSRAVAHVDAPPPAPVIAEAAPSPVAASIHEPEPAAAPIPAPKPPQTTEAEIVLDVDVTETTQDTVVAVATDEASPPAALESRERLVAAEPVAEPTVVESEVPAAELSDEEIEEAPASSRRPVGPQPEERLAEMAFGAEEPSPPRHTPPPESGRLPAAPPVQEFDADTTGVREAAKPLTRPPEPAPEPSVPAELAPVALRAELPTAEAVADVVGRTERSMATKFVELLDASLAL